MVSSILLLKNLKQPQRPLAMSSPGLLPAVWRAVSRLLGGGGEGFIWSVNLPPTRCWDLSRRSEWPVWPPLSSWLRSITDPDLINRECRAGSLQPNVSALYFLPVVCYTQNFTLFKMSHYFQLERHLGMMMWLQTKKKKLAQFLQLPLWSCKNCGIYRRYKDVVWMLHLMLSSVFW